MTGSRGHESTGYREKNLQRKIGKLQTTRRA